MHKLVITKSNTTFAFACIVNILFCSNKARSHSLLSAKGVIRNDTCHSSSVKSSCETRDFKRYSFEFLESGNVSLHVNISYYIIYWIFLHPHRLDTLSTLIMKYYCVSFEFVKKWRCWGLNKANKYVTVALNRCFYFCFPEKQMFACVIEKQFQTVCASPSAIDLWKFFS